MSWYTPWIKSRQAKWTSLALGAVILLLFILVGLTASTWPQAVSVAEAAGKKVKLEFLVHTWSWRGLVVNVGVLLLLLGTLPWWLRPSRQQKSAHHVVPLTRYQVLIGVVLITTACVLRSPRLSLSFYNDEAHNFVRMVAGDWKPGKTDDVPVLREATWYETLWYNGSGNNSQPHSLFSRLTYRAWQNLAKAPLGEVNEVAVRVPAFLASALTLAFLGLAVRRMVSAEAAFWVLVAAGLHGWMTHYATEARGYSLMLLGITAGWFFLDRALQSGRWRDWMGYGGAIFWTIWSFPGAIYFLAVQNGLLMGRQLWRCWRQQDDWSQVLRPIIVGLLAVVLALPLMLPLIPQLITMLQSFPSIHGAMGMDWWQDYAGHALVGGRWRDHDPQNPVFISLSRWILENPWWWLPLALVIGLMLIGMVRLIRRGGAAALLAIVGPLSVAVAWQSMNSKGQFLHHWYGLYAVPSLLAAFAVGLVTLGMGLRCSRWRWPVLGALAAVALSLPAVITWKLRTLPKQDQRGAVLTVRGQEYPHYPNHEALLAGLWCDTGIYDPYLIRIKSDDALDPLVDQARKEGRELYVCFSHRGLAVQYMPLSLTRMEQSGDFELVATYWGQFEEQFNSRLYRLRR